MAHRVPTRSSTQLKYLRLQERYQELYNVQRLRHDDVIARLMDEFFIQQENTIYRILGTEIKRPDEPQKGYKEQTLFDT